MSITHFSKSSVLKVKQLQVTVRFGLLSLQCKGKGICTVTAEKLDYENTGYDYAIALLYVEPNNKLTLCISKEKLLPGIEDKYFSSSFFEVQEAYTFPKELLKDIGLQQYTIEPGNYPLEDKGQFWKIIFLTKY